MIADTTYLANLVNEDRAGMRGPARQFFHSHRTERFRTTVISLGEVAISFASPDAAWEYFSFLRIYPLHRGIVDAAVYVDRELIRTGGRLGENDNWIAGFARYYREPIISQDAAFDRVRGIRRIGY